MRLQGDPFEARDNPEPDTAFDHFCDWAFMLLLLAFLIIGFIMKK